nr:PepSY-like domain-containing protein [uncultured Dyadobacter sp.]
MKHLPILTAILLTLLACEKKEEISPPKLSENERDFIELHFPAITASSIVREEDHANITSLTITENNIELKFNSRGKCISVENKNRSKLPDSILPENVLRYIKYHYPNDFIIKWRKDEVGQRVQLNTGKEVTFDMHDNFLKIERRLIVRSEKFLPNNANEFIILHFPSATILKIDFDHDGPKSVYEAILDNQIQLKFDNHGVCLSIENKKSQKLPQSVIPIKIYTYVKEQYPGTFITEWSTEEFGQEVKLSSGIDLIFNLDGNFLKIDK